MMTQTATSDTPNIAQNYLQMPYNQYIWVRKEFMEICEDLLEAMILRVVEYEIEGDRRVWVRKATEQIEQGKSAPEEPEWWITLSHKQILARLYNNAIKNEKTLRAKLKSLIEDKKFLLVRDNPDNHYGAPQYTINKELLQKLLGGLPPLPGLKEAARSQATPLPETVPPTRNGTPYQSRKGVPPKTGTAPLPETVPATSQNRQVPPPKTGRTNKNRENSKNYKNTEERLNTPASSTPANDSLSQSSSSLNSQKNEEPKALIQHPLHNFIFLDDPLQPTTLFLQLGDPLDEQGNDSRVWVAHDVQAELEAELGYGLQRRSSYEQKSVAGSVVATTDAHPFSPDPESQGCASESSSGLRIAPQSASMAEVNTATSSPSLPQEKPSRASQISGWLDDLKIFSDKAKRDGYIALLAAEPRIASREALISLRDHASNELLRQYGVPKRVFLGNMVGCLKDWVALKSPGQAKPSSESRDDTTMDQVKAETLAQSLLPLYPAELLGTAQPYPGKDIWCLALRYGAGSEDWVYFESPEHYRDPSPWELERIIDARVLARLIMEEAS